MSLKNLILALFYIVGCITLNAQNIEIRQENDDILIFNESEQTAEVWIEMEDKAINEVVPKGVMKKYVNEGYLTNRMVEDSKILYAYSYRALFFDINASLTEFDKQLEQKRSILNRGYEKINKPFYRTDVFQEFLDSDNARRRIQQLPAKDVNQFIRLFILPKHRGLLAAINKKEGNYKEQILNKLNGFLTTTVLDESELSMFVEEMNHLQTYFDKYRADDNQLIDKGSLVDNGFKLFHRKGNPGFNIGVYITTNNLKLIRNYNYREMETRGLNFEAEISQRLYLARVAKRRTLNLYGAASYLSIKDKEFDLKKSFINIGPQIRYAGFYENQLELVAEAGATIDITKDKYMNPLDEKKTSYYAGGQLSLLFFRFGMRYYDQLTTPELSPEGQWFYRLGIVAKF